MEPKGKDEMSEAANKYYQEKFGVTRVGKYDEWLKEAFDDGAASQRESSATNMREKLPICPFHKVVCETDSHGGWRETYCPKCRAESETPEAAHRRTRERAERRKRSKLRRSSAT